MASNSCIQTYSRQADALARQYERLAPDVIHKSWAHCLHRPRQYVLDIGAGSGRDAAWMASLGHQVSAVEPAARLLRVAKRLHSNPNIDWIADRLPDLKRVFLRKRTFDLILLNAVWMHVHPDERDFALANLSALTAEGGVLIVTVRHGISPPGREMYRVCLDELVERAGKFGFWLASSQSSHDLLGRSRVSWDTLVFEQGSRGAGDKNGKRRKDMSNDAQDYECGKCGNRRHSAVGDPDCCGQPMRPVEPLPVCQASDTPEHARTEDIEEPCDDGRAGKT